jgi:predicted enzyme related to lactoylglutathione lyase
MDHTICHFEIPVEDLDRSAEFYRGLFGWEINKWAGSETPISMVNTVPTDEKGRPTRPGVNGMLIKKQNPQHPFANYVNVESVDDYAKKAVELGGQIAMPKTPVPGMGWFLYIKDLDDNILGLWQEDPTAAAG